MPDDRSEETHCYFVALEALRAGADPLAAAARHIRPSGLLTGPERAIANRAVLAAQADIGKWEGQHA